MTINIHIAASHLTQNGLSSAVTAAVAVGMKVNLDMSALIGRRAGSALTITGIYGVIQKAADCANRLNYTLPAYYAALYEKELEMMYFLIDPLFVNSGALKNTSPSDNEISKIITTMIR